MSELIDIFKVVGVAGIIDILFMSALIYALIIWFKRSKAVFVLIGLFIIGVIYLAAREFNLQLTAVVLQGFFAVILIAVIVIFQEELKHMFERLAVWSLNRRLTRHKVLHLQPKEVEIIVRTVTDLANDKIGALLVLRGQDAIVRHINGGWDLNGELSEPLLKSLFDPHSAGHDGAIIIENNHILQFGCHLPLSKDLKKIPKGGGTRHAAGLGLSELTDALCMVISEERGTISVARYGEIETISDPEKLSLILQRFFEESSPSRKEMGKNLFTKNIREKTTALVITVGLWFVFVHEGRPTYHSFKAKVEYTNLPAEMDLVEIKPSEVDVMLSGPRRHFYFVSRKRIKIVLNMVGQKEGFHSKTIQRSNVVIPEKLELETIVPSKVRVVTRLREPEPPKS